MSFRLTGHFGCVYKAYLQKEGIKEEQVVAAKTLHSKYNCRMSKTPCIFLVGMSLH